MIIKLPNFFEDNRLNSLKEKMGIDRYAYGDYKDCQSQGVRELLNGKGQDFDDINEITPSRDHTLTYNNERIILYIRDVANYGHYGLPKFHIAKCSTLQTMFENNRKRRYVRTQNETGIFYLNIISGNNVREIEEKLDVCQNCLNILDWDGFSMGWDRAKRDKYVRDFTIARFFEKYPKSLVDSSGYSSTNSSVNQYPKNWNEISLNYRVFKNWTCEKCGVNLANYTSLLETHHTNGQKNECQYSNLMALCADCHSKMPMHSHMSNNPREREKIEQVKRIKREQGIFI
ncbi:hypothetical protein [Moraxella bovoculi]|uniref:hypothetical protein n=1 Tax=Moraxella bovoculi TaxID=386891 RepID=UPI0006249E71|nr:hypothetical protein [Moraxella bovoculi]AKG17400.1 hypothetical protein AAX10_06850 [Moraxella bovoculi]ALT07540.1 hypothetical protein AAX08_07155 [Moraxella bovoculi]